MSETDARDTHAREYDAWHGAEVAALADEEPQPTACWHLMAEQYLGDVKGLRVLEIACGLGAFSKLLASRGAHVTAADISAEAVTYAQQLLAPYDGVALEADAMSIPFDDETFDLVVSLETLEHTFEPKVALAELVRVTKRSGRLIVTTPNYMSMRGLMRLVYLAAGKGWSELGQTFVRPVTTIGRVRELRRLGCRVDATDGRLQEFPIPGWQTVNPEWIQHPHAVMKWVATHGCTVATRL